MSAVIAPYTRCRLGYGIFPFGGPVVLMDIIFMFLAGDTNSEERTFCGSLPKHDHFAKATDYTCPVNFTDSKIIGVAMLVSNEPVHYNIFIRLTLCTLRLGYNVA